jgi:hypothetical protein
MLAVPMNKWDGQKLFDPSEVRKCQKVQRFWMTEAGSWKPETRNQTTGQREEGGRERERGESRYTMQRL